MILYLFSELVDKFIFVVLFFIGFLSEGLEFCLDVFVHEVELFYLLAEVVDD